MGKKQENSKLFSENHSFIHIMNNSTFHSNTKHIKIEYHFIRSILEDELLNLEKIHSSQNPIDMLTKVVTREKLSY